MNDNISISIIIPVYNAEKYLRQCLDSIINQTFKDFECICINDGSTDKSLSILQEYANKDNRIKIISQKNIGVAKSRNNGLSVAMGEYILFVDSDDFIDTKFCEVLYTDAIKYKAELVFGGIYTYYSDNHKRNCNVLKEFCKEKADNCFIKHISIDEKDRPFFFSKFYQGHIVTWGRLIRKQLLKDNEIYFYETSSAEDYTFTALNLLYANNIVINETVNYYYRKGISNSLSKKNDIWFKGLLKNLKTLKEDLVNRKQNNDDIIKLIDLAVTDILFGYYDDWNVGRLSKCSLQTVKEFCSKSDFYLKFFNIEQSVRNSKNKIYKIKYMLFYFAVKHNVLYIMLKMMRIFRNILRVFCFK